MNKVRNFFGKMGIPLDRRALLIASAVLMTCMAVIMIAFFPLVTQIYYVKVLLILAAAPGAIILLGGVYRPLFWGMADERGKTQIEKEVTVSLLRRWLRAQPKEKSM